MNGEALGEGMHNPLQLMVSFRSSNRLGLSLMRSVVEIGIWPRRFVGLSEVLPSILARVRARRAVMLGFAFSRPWVLCMKRAGLRVGIAWGYVSAADSPPRTDRRRRRIP
jgi:hypothetical protein